MYQLILTNKAIDDITEVEEWYEKQQKELGYKFADHIFNCLEEIKRYPLAYPCKHKHTREMYVRKFPYLILYSIEEKILFILRIFPCKTDPKKKYK